MRELGALWDRDPLQAMRLAAEAGYVLAAERACGVDEPRRCWTWTTASAR